MVKSRNLFKVRNLNQFKPPKIVVYILFLISEYNEWPFKYLFFQSVGWSFVNRIKVQQLSACSRAVYLTQLPSLPFKIKHSLADCIFDDLPASIFGFKLLITNHQNLKATEHTIC